MQQRKLIPNAEVARLKHAPAAKNINNKDNLQNNKNSKRGVGNGN